MSSDYEHPPESISMRVLRTVGPWIALMLIGMIVLGYLWQYHTDTRAVDGESGFQAAEESTQRPETDSGGLDAVSGASEGDTPATYRYVRVLTDNLNLRAEPTTSASVIKTLKAGVRLALLETGSGWYRVRDEAGDVGWVAAGGRYTELVE